MPTAYGFLLLLIILGTWMVAACMFGTAFLVAYNYNDYTMVAVILMYYSYRHFKPASEWPRVRNMFTEGWKAKSYFRSQRTVIEEEIEPNSKTLIAAHPHGILCCGMITTLVCSPELVESKISFLVSDILFKLPIVSDMLTWTQCAPADKKTVISSMRAGENISILPGGYQEATLYQRHQHRVFIKTRKGFIKYALMHGYKVHPSYIFGEERTFLAASWLQEKFMFLNKWKLPACFFMGKYIMFMPEDELDMVTVVGRPLVLPLIETPTKADVDFWHGRYMEELQSVFDRNKWKYAADPLAKLVML